MIPVNGVQCCFVNRLALIIDKRIFGGKIPLNSQKNLFRGWARRLFLHVYQPLLSEKQQKITFLQFVLGGLAFPLPLD
jgi:hypothetical protein